MGWGGILGNQGGESAPDRESAAEEARPQPGEGEKARDPGSCASRNPKNRVAQSRSTVAAMP
jgi:hypothetical protein